MQGKARDILILLRITDFFTTGSAGMILVKTVNYYFLFIKLTK
jgi:hypothetical protein